MNELSLSDIASYAEIIGAGSIVTGLLFGWFQIRHFRAQQRDTVAINLMQTFYNGNLANSIALLQPLPDGISLAEVHAKGTHTTTFAEMFPLADNDGFIIDTPGIKEFGMIDMRKEEISHFFPEIFKVSDNCKFNNCQHLNEPNCAVISAIDEGLIPESRYSSYISIIESIKQLQ